MNEMYNMGLSLHSLGAVAILMVIFMNLYFLISYTDLKKYKRIHSIVLWPITFTILGLVIFTGIVMMAAKHLDFTLANIIMIIISIVYITLEVKRVKTLRYLNEKKEHAFNAYKPLARTILQIEFVLIVLISLGMWFI
jgi:type IV secretory pathway VirB2 component (pilin)